MKILLSNSSPLPIYEQIKDEIRRQIVTGEIENGQALPSIRKLALNLQISVITTKRAYDDLEKEGLITSVAGKGTFAAAMNKDLIKEKRLKVVESKLEEAVKAARALGIKDKELAKLMSLLLKED